MTSPEDLRSKNMGMWFRDGSENTLRTKYLLDENSVVFDLGGYMGQWAGEIFNKYKCNIHVFEPIFNFYTHIKNNLVNDKIIVEHVGLSNKNYNEVIYIANDSSSIYQNKNNKSENIKMINICDYMNGNNIQKIDLIKINVEGEEYNILEELLSNDKIKNIGDIQIQFHDIFPDSIERRIKIREELSKTHEETYCFDFVWENWKNKIEII